MGARTQEREREIARASEREIFLAINREERARERQKEEMQNLEQRSIINGADASAGNLQRERERER